MGNKVKSLKEKSKADYKNWKFSLGVQLYIGFDFQFLWSLPKIVYL